MEGERDEAIWPWNEGRWKLPGVRLLERGLCARDFRQRHPFDVPDKYLVRAHLS